MCGVAANWGYGFIRQTVVGHLKHLKSAWTLLESFIQVSVTVTKTCPCFDVSVSSQLPYMRIVMRSNGVFAFFKVLFTFGGETFLILRYAHCDNLKNCI